MTTRTKWLAGLAALLIAVVAYTAGVLTPGLRAPGDKSVEAGFARDMSVHHAQAVAMAMIMWQAPLLTDTPTDVQASTEIQTLAYDIATDQQEQIGEMSAWLNTWHLLPTSTQPRMAWMPDGTAELKNGLMPGMATTDQMNQLSATKGKALDILFCQLMLNHHLGGIHMVEGVLSVTKNGLVRTLATAMKEGQQREVAQMQQLLTTLGAQPLSG